MDSLPKLLTPSELAQETGLDRRLIVVAARDGLLPCVRLGRRLLFDRAAVQEWIRAGGKTYPGGWRRERAS